jgi:gluconokinase
MSKSDVILAVDIGTGATKAVLFDSSLKQVSLVRRHYPIHVYNKGWSEQEPEVIYQGVLEAIRAALQACPTGYSVKALSISAQLYSVLAVTPDGKPLTNSIPWSDTRSAEQVARLRQHPLAEGIRQRTGCPIDSVYPRAKIQWIQENLSLPEDARFISIKEYVIHRLTGQFLADWSIASATGLFDIKNKTWDATALEQLGIAAKNLSELVSTRTVLAIRDEARQDAGIPPGLPLIIGGGDGPLASLGVGALGTNGLAVNVGTSAAARAVIRKPQIDPAGQLWTYLIDDGLWVTGGMVSSGGIVLEWFLENFFLAQAIEEGGFSATLYTQVDRLAGDAPAGAEGLLFIPYLSGAQCPDWSPETRGSFIGLDLKHRRGHISRAVLEGITRSIFRIAEAIQGLLDRQFEEVYVTGGLTASSLWLQIAADMFGASVIVPETSEGSARGAAMLAMIALGMKSGLDDFDGLSVAKRRVDPNMSAHGYYQEQYQRFLHALQQAGKL